VPNLSLSVPICLGSEVSGYHYEPCRDANNLSEWKILEDTVASTETARPVISHFSSCDSDFSFTRVEYEKADRTNASLARYPIHGASTNLTSVPRVCV